MQRFLLLIALVASGCVAPPEAPAELDELSVWLFSHHQDEDPAAMISGIDRLADFVDASLEDSLDEDWDISSLTEETVDDVDDVDRSTDGMVAIAVFTESDYTVDDAAFAMVGSEIDEVYPDSFSEYERTWDTDHECFLDLSCDRTSASEHYQAEFPLNLHTISELQNEYVWVEGSERRAMVQRNWLISPPETNSSLLEVDEQFHLNMFIESASGGFVRLQAAWMIVTQDAVNPVTAVRLVGDNYRTNSETLDAYLDENAP
ncbi:MAG: hypothetical protein GY898_33975 [Proteobacteria bacterium]|nr:hypothetical protein [Pseudomonadota bacterium]